MSDEKQAQDTQGEQRLYAGKYQTVEALEEAYKNSAKVFNENKELHSRIESLSKIPETYQKPDDIALTGNELAEIERIAKQAGLNQDQFSKTAREMQSRIMQQRKEFEDAKNAIDKTELNLVTDYVKNYYPEKLQEAVLNTLIKDKTAMSDALKHREQLLNSSAPGMSGATGHTPAPKYDGHDEMMKARAEYTKNPTERNRNKYIKLAEEVGHSRGFGAQ
jgi:uncharacterized phage infection (PIP) family protein YhgE